MVIIPALVFVGGLYYASRAFSLLTTTGLGLLTLEGRVAKKENEILHSKLQAGVNPEYEEFALEKRRSELMRFGLSKQTVEEALAANPPSVEYIPVTLKLEDIPPHFSYLKDLLVGDWLLTRSEHAQLSDLLKGLNLSMGHQEGERVRAICLEKGVDIMELSSLSWPVSSFENVDVAWLRRMSDIRLADPSVLGDLQRG